MWFSRLNIHCVSPPPFFKRREKLSGVMHLKSRKRSQMRCCAVSPMKTKSVFGSSPQRLSEMDLSKPPERGTSWSFARYMISIETELSLSITTSPTMETTSKLNDQEIQELLNVVLLKEENSGVDDFEKWNKIHCKLAKLFSAKCETEVGEFSRPTCFFYQLMRN